MDWTAVGTAGGALLVALLGWYGKRRLTKESRNVTTLQLAERREEAIAHREARTFALMEARIDDLEQALDRVVASERRLRDDVDRLRGERDELQQKLMAAQFELAAHKTHD